MKICKRESAKRMLNLGLYAFLLRLKLGCVLPPLSPKCLLKKKKSRRMTTTVFVSERERFFFQLMSMLAKMTTLLLLTFSIECLEYGDDLEFYKPVD